MKKVMLFFLLVPLFLEAQVGYKGSSNGSLITIDIADSRYAFAEGNKTVLVFQTKNVTLDSTLSSFIGDACESYISMTSKKKQGVLKAGQVFSVNRGFVDKVLPITGGCVILTKDPSINFEVSTSYATVSAAMIQCASGMSSESTDAENGLYLDGTTVKMGGYLTENTVIYGDNHYMILDSLIGLSVKAINNDDAEAYLTLSTNLAQPSTLSHYEMATGNYAAVSLDGDGVSTFKSADDNDLDYAEVNVSYEDLKASMKAVVNDGVGYSEVSVAANVLIHASDDISIDCSGQIDIVNNAGSGINIGNGNSPVKITPEGSPVVADGWILGFSDASYNLTAIDPSTLTTSLTDGYVAYGTGTGLTGESAFSYNSTTNVLTIPKVSISENSAVSLPTATLIGTWFTGGSATTTKPHFLLEPTGTTSTAWSTSGTGLGINAASGFVGNLIDLKTNNTSHFYVTGAGTGVFTGAVQVNGNINFSTMSGGTTISQNGVFTGSNNTAFTIGGTTTATQSIFNVTKSFTAAGTTTFTGYEFGATINQAGSGITRGIYINPTLTLVSDFRAIDVTRGRSIFAARVSLGKGANVASAATTTLGDDGNLFHITGTTNIDNITVTNWQAGSEVTLIFDGVLTVGDGTGNIKLSSNFTTTADDVLVLVYDGTSWFEIQRSVN